MKVRYIELPEMHRIGGLEKAAADMARYLAGTGVQVFRGSGPVDRFGKVDLVHFHGLWSPAHLRGSALCRRRGIPHVVSPHGMLEPWAWRHRRWKKWPYFHLFEKRRLNRADAILATAPAEAENIRRFFPHKLVEILSLGIEPDIFPDYEAARASLGWAEQEKVLLYLSRIHPKKGLLELLESLAILFAEGLSAKLRLVILGDGPAEYVNACRKAAQRLAGRMSVDWLPPQWGEGKWKFLQGADLFCLPTYSENFGIVILEAGIVGTPVFTTTGTPWKVVADAGFGWVVDPDPALYPDVLRSFLNRPSVDLQSRRSSFAQWTRRHYAWPVLIEYYNKFYGRLIRRNSHEC